MRHNGDAGGTGLAAPGAAGRAATVPAPLAPRGSAGPLSAASAQLSRLGVPAAASDVVTSGHAAARLLARRLPPGARVLVVGGNGLRVALRERGLRPVSAAAERPAAVVQGFSPDLSYALLAEGALAVACGALFVATNADVTLPTARGAEMGNGALVQAIVAATGQRPVVAGKPESPLHAEAVERTGAKRPLVVGDRLDTDIEGAVRAGADSLLVLTGVSSPADVVLAAPRQRPAYLAADLAGLLEPHPQVTSADGAAQCGGWTARLDSGRQRLELAGAGEPIDGLRALCGAAWPAGTVTAEMVRPALAELGLAD